ncbi:UNVERIFIED_CONTAM: hypothetical protein GTU68_045536 [Idotea baltica]|nr:hypothetical protein [Idotea baltica]
MLSNRWGWIIMELPALFTVPFLFFMNDTGTNNIVLVFVAMWIFHYFHRTLIFPFRIKTKNKKIPWIIVIFGMFFNLINGYFIGIWLTTQSDTYSISWLETPCMWVGISLFITGILINLSSDYRLLRLRKPGETGYKIPFGGFFNWVSCPNHFGEIIEWIGFAIMTWSPAGFAFAIWTAINLIPRSLDHHRWYHLNFPDYPQNRKAVIPFLL